MLALDAVAPLAAAATARSARLSKLAAAAREGPRCAACASLAPPAPPAALTARFAWHGDALDALLRAALPSAPHAPPPRVVLVGLHACGDLTPALLRGFADADAAVAAVVVGCCYNLVTEAPGANIGGEAERDSGGGGERLAADAILRSTAAAAAQRHGGGEQGCCSGAEPGTERADAPPGFPLSCAGAALALRLGRRARMLACPSSARWDTPAGAPSASTLQRHAFRAALEVVLQRFYPGLPHDALTLGRQGAASGDGSSAEGAAADADADADAFVREATDAVAAAGLCASLTPPAALHALWRDELAPHAALLGAFCTLRAVLAGPLESLLLLDRLLYAREALRERGCSAADAALLPLFDPVLSPRNVALVARKRRLSEHG